MILNYFVKNKWNVYAYLYLSPSIADGLLQNCIFLVTFLKYAPHQITNQTILTRHSDDIYTYLFLYIDIK